MPKTVKSQVADLTLTEMRSRHAVSITDFKKNPARIVAAAEGDAIAVLNHNRPEFYVLPAAAFEALLDRIEDLEDVQTIRERENQPRVAVELDDL